MDGSIQQKDDRKIGRFSTIHHIETFQTFPQAAITQYIIYNYRAQFASITASIVMSMIPLLMYFYPIP
jgi:hypothetical protein